MSIEQELRDHVEWLSKIRDQLINSALLESDKAIDECVKKTGLTREEVIAYTNRKANKRS